MNRIDPTLSRLRRRDRARFWAHAATFGALWGALEATVGSFLHALHVPFAGVFLASCGAALLLALRVVHPVRGVVLAAGAVCACVKMIAPSTMVLGPMVGILVESLLVEIACAPLGANPGSAIVGGALATVWSLSQKVLTQIVLFGAPVVEWTLQILKSAEAWFKLPRGGGLWVIVVFVSVIALLGSLGGLMGLRAGRKASLAPRSTGKRALGEAVTP